MGRTHISEVYAEELLTAGLGYPMWHPEPDKITGTPEIGDVGYINKGKFIQLFNIVQDRDSNRNKKGVPENYVPVKYDPDLTREYDQATTSIHSKGVKSRTIEVGLGACVH